MYVYKYTLTNHTILFLFWTINAWATFKNDVFNHKNDLKIRDSIPVDLIFFIIKDLFLLAEDK